MHCFLATWHKLHVGSKGEVKVCLNDLEDFLFFNTWQKLPVVF